MDPVDLIKAPYHVAYFIAFVLGAISGSFVNVLALRSLANQSILYPASHCSHCQHRLAAPDLIPIISYCLLQGRCRYCKQKIHWHYPVVETITGVVFVYMLYVVDANFVPYLAETGRGAAFVWELLAGLAILSIVLMAVAVTDFKEKLIPHEITYPSIILGLIFAHLVRNDFVGSMMAVGMSYLIFDFIAHYGLKIYLYLHPELNPDHPDFDPELLECPPDEDPDLDQDVDLELDLDLDLNLALALQKNEIEDHLEPAPQETPYFGDPVMASVPASFLGLHWMPLTIALGFIAGLPRLPRISVDILYPIIVSGIAYSFFYRQDIAGALGAVGLCYIVFDFFGLYKEKWREKHTKSPEPVPPAPQTIHCDPYLDASLSLQLNERGGRTYEPIEVMGGGDAVLAALIGAWLGWERLMSTVIIAFIVGAVMGLIYLLLDLHARHQLNKVLRPALGGFLIFGSIPVALLLTASYLTHYTELLSSPTIWSLPPLIGLAGAILGMTNKGLRLTKTFPFGPALVLAALISLYWASGNQFDSFIK